MRGNSPASPAFSAAHGHLALDDLVCWSAVDHRFAGEGLPATRAAKVTLGVV